MGITYIAIYATFYNLFLFRYIGRMIDAVDQRLLQIKMPSHVNRPPRRRSFGRVTIHNFITQVTIAASEWKSFMLYYIPTILYGILPMKYYIHVFLLIQSMRILLGEYIDNETLKLAEQLLAKFCRLTEQYYG